MAYKRYNPYNGNGINGEDPKKVKSNPSRQEMEQEQYGGDDLQHWNTQESLGEISREDNQRLNTEYKDRELTKGRARSAKQEVSEQVGIQNATGRNSVGVTKALVGSKLANENYSKAYHTYRRDSILTTNKYKR